MMTVKKQHLAKAVEDGERVVFGLPVKAELDDGTIAHLNLAAAHRGHPMPYTATKVEGEIIHIAGNAASKSHIAGMGVAPEDQDAFLEALRLAPGLENRHSPKANAQRLAAGKKALEIKDNMVRARTLDHVDGWMALKEMSDIVDQSEEGLLLKPKGELGIKCLVLVVRCPSTGRVYALRTPPEHQTAKDARKWVMRGESPEVET